MTAKINELKSEHCYKCGNRTLNGYIFCENCTPCYGQTISFIAPTSGKRWRVFVGTIPFWQVVWSWLRGIRTIKWWMGSDALTLWSVPPGRNRLEIFLHRLKMRLLKPFITRHWVTSSRLVVDLARSKSVLPDKIAIVYWPGRHHQPVRKQPHVGFNILYYDPGKDKFKRWVYGIDIIETVQVKLTGVNWVKIDGRQNMAEIFPITDLYLRPSRHDGAPRIIEECRLNNIPVVYSEDGKPLVETIVQEILAIKNKAEPPPPSNKP